MKVRVVKTPIVAMAFMAPRAAALIVISKCLKTTALESVSGKGKPGTGTGAENLFFRRTRTKAIPSGFWCTSICQQILITKIGKHTSELQSRGHLVCRLLLEKKKKNNSRT